MLVKRIVQHACTYSELVSRSPLQLQSGPWVGSRAYSGAAIRTQQNICCSCASVLKNTRDAVEYLKIIFFQTQYAHSSLPGRQQQPFEKHSKH